MLSYLQTLSHWDWFLFAGILLIVEVLGTAGYFLLFGTAALIVGIVVWIFPSFHWAFQYLLFSLLSLASAYFWWMHLKRCVPKKQHLNKRGSELVGQQFKLHEGINAGRGKIRVGDGFWIVTGADLAQGTLVKVVSQDGVLLKVVAV